ncbi:hypothetical protein [Burkholderia vietnamiensis]|uniref:Uncharacterized protein n=1 Tax=Burkholderia vietnamiensis TaxID=60552 RepID=A0AAW7T239_BURVI|nr:hypothetical protein [Burkholderia vietnamiensis]MBR8361558.1 hypothetical protein [Burkholderia vietnamiensis]MDN7796063.1 hypothetical protein [Burkholderia vietnamiensis]HDR9073943.1 hypothetical protein [Burkholderia vietnamiensis]HDR9192474.1 hypothetical protein [Burkholderia vietnamiensis]
MIGQHRLHDIRNDVVDFAVSRRGQPMQEFPLLSDQVTILFHLNVFTARNKTIFPANRAGHIGMDSERPAAAAFESGQLART